MGLGGLGGKVNMNAMEAQLNKNMKLAKTKERIKAKAEANLKAKLAKQTELNSHPVQQKPEISDEELLKIFSTGEKVQRSPRGGIVNQNQNQNKKKKKNKK
jgi:hypothetical protein